MTQDTIPNLMARLRYRQQHDGRTLAQFPPFHAGHTSTRDYVLAFLGNNGARHLNLAALPYTPAPWIDGPEVTVEDCDG